MQKMMDKEELLDKAIHEVNFIYLCLCVCLRVCQQSEAVYLSGAEGQDAKDDEQRVASGQSYSQVNAWI